MTALWRPGVQPAIARAVWEFQALTGCEKVDVQYRYNLLICLASYFLHALLAADFSRRTMQY